MAALIATLVASLVGVLRSQALSRQSDFYQHLLQVNTSLTTGANFLQLMNTAIHTHIDTADVWALLILKYPCPRRRCITQAKPEIHENKEYKKRIKKFEDIRRNIDV